MNGSPAGVFQIPGGDLPVMVLSKACNLSRLSRANFPKHGEEEREVGGYFIVNGKERVLRLLVMTRRNFPLAISRSSFKKRGHGYTEHAVIMRCVREDETVALMMLHWLMNGEPTLAFVVEREQFFVPISILLRAKICQTLDSTRDHVLARSRKGKVRINATFVHQSLLLLATEIGISMNYMLATGNLPPSVRAALSPQFGGQSTGLSVPADNVNFLRLAAQFRAVHRGSIFTDIRTTTVRRLLPEAWGFLCPVHTPDGAPCGLLNHLAEPVESPRNMYQCQMAKQTMGHSCYTWRNRSDAKAYRLLTPQSPLVRTKTYVKYDLDHYPLGFNAVVAVMSYTGYDMEDAMVINKGSYERGLAGACIYKSEILDLALLSKQSSSRGQPFSRRKQSLAEYYFGTGQTWFQLLGHLEMIWSWLAMDCNMEAHIYIGVVYYQRLRHMVADKYQVRAEGRFEPILRQPIKGRKVGGGIRLGEMERDCLLSQGLTFTLQDRMVESNCDSVTMLACSKCGGLVHTDLSRNVSGNSDEALSLLDTGSSWHSSSFSGPFDRTHWSCRLCDQNEDHSEALTGRSKSHLKLVRVPASFRYLTYELACLNVHTQLAVGDLA
ncbi:DNA-directed RNA polymerase subunit beta [Fasciola gigantica]|uniref:DNA-directed RNA polymerase n=1 Tax=Fasciola gigantica TaxID=46835 RepID=A0A504YC08_FASGI|nr:DNA-directed RNA polymerase subunit beta [Fasciola gigantica]